MRKRINSLLAFILFIALLIAFLLALGGCSPHEAEHYIEPELQEYFNKFHEEANRLNVELPEMSVLMYFEDSLTYYKGWYISNKHGAKIQIKRVEHGPQLEATIFHELGHAYLGREHMPKDETLNYEPSLMTPAYYGRWAWADGSKREYYLKELFEVL